MTNRQAKKQTEEGGGERQKKTHFLSVAQHWFSVRAAAKGAVSVPLLHSEPL